MLKLEIMIKPVLYALIFSILMTGCKQKDKSAFVVNLTYQNLDKMKGFELENGVNNPDSVKGKTNPKILLEEIPYGPGTSPVILDSATLSTNGGKLKLKGNGKQEAIFQITVENGPALLVINDAEEININIDLSKHDDYYSVTGSDASKRLKDFILMYSQKTFDANRSFAYIDSLKQLGASDSLVIIATNKKNDDLAKLNQYLKSFISGSSHPALSLFALSWASRSLPKAEFETALDQVVKKFPAHETLKTVKSTYEQQKNQAAAPASPGQGSWIGRLAPDLAMPGLDNNALSISSFKGKYLLVDFWASWCGPCRQENPNVVKVYNQFKNKNFTILGVSLDQDKAKWADAVKQDNLNWNQMSDLKAWDSKSVEVYKFEGIPFNVLIDPSGKVIAENLRGFDLEKTLSEVLK